jgi:stage V sporulation protein S
MTKLIKVATHSESSLVAGAIVGLLRETQQAEVQAIGANAVNQAVKAVAIARSYLDEHDLDLTMAPSFTKVQINDQAQTALRFHIRLCPKYRIPDHCHSQQEKTHA